MKTSRIQRMKEMNFKFGGGHGTIAKIVNIASTHHHVLKQQTMLKT
jgi:hypothetical protein